MSKAYFCKTISAVLNLRGLSRCLHFILFFVSVSCLEMIESHLLSGKNSFVCLKLSVGKKLWFSLSCILAFPMEFSLDGKEREMVKSNWYSRITPSFLNLSIKYSSLPLFKALLYVAE